MTTEDACDFHAEVGSIGALMGLDLGTKTIGIAISDPLRNVATASEVIARKKFSDYAQKLLAIIEAREIRGMVLGLPKNMDNSEGPRAQAARAFARNLENKFAPDCPPILLWDERLSTVEAERAMIEADMSRKKRAQKIDAVAASLILQGALDRLRNLSHE